MFLENNRGMALTGQSSGTTVKSHALLNREACTIQYLGGWGNMVPPGAQNIQICTEEGHAHSELIPVAMGILELELWKEHQ